jgi:cytochrome c biogenesis factor
VDPNPEAIAWYVEKSEGLLSDLRARVLALRSRGGQLAGFSGAVLALIGANAESILDALHGTARGAAGVSLLAGSLLLVASLATALRGTLLPQPVSDISAKEVANYTSARFTNEPDLWRVHLRAIQSLLAAIVSMTEHVDSAARFVERAEYFFFAGLFTVGAAFATLIVEVTF